MNAQTQPKADTSAPVQLPAVVRKQEIRVVNDPIPVLDTARFEHMQRIASVMANSNLIPESLCMTTEGEGNSKTKVMLQASQVVANCFLVVNQAVRWGMDPFAVAQCVSVVHGKLCYEGKLIAAVIEAKLGIRLKFDWDNKQGDQLGITVSGQFHNEDEPRIVQGTVAEWKTTGNGSPWTPKQSKKMLAYRGAREWGRLHAPSLMLGVYSDDELDALSDDRRARVANDISPADDGPPAPPTRQIAPHAQTVIPEIASRPSDIELVESGRDDGRQVVWDEQGETPAPATATSDDLDVRNQPFARPTPEPEWRRRAEAALAECRDAESLFNVHKNIILPEKGKAFPPDWQAVMTAYKTNFDRINAVA